MSLIRRTVPFLAVTLAFALTAATTVTALRGGELDGFSIGRLPAAIDEETSVSDFEYEWGDVSFTSRVWERARDGGGFEVVLQILVMRGASLTDLDALHTFLAEYHERSPDEWDLTPFDNGDLPALHGDTEAFWTPATGVGIEVRDAFGILGQEELLATARGITFDDPA
ncbi:hypothetical protein [Nocardiopsis lambiniae]|uniref:Uncharacterized protein n=1 Tax=Nocardiopsis lambiniae TaxID=3075539 RepID=A0ABU2M9N5_9ACTN|nr:hypothetical protein [Nocardiopsis sp. DSM 44743]MDT0328880.1 hypothetical protein [Nocardiopsis sp. DSM 44743]